MRVSQEAVNASQAQRTVRSRTRVDQEVGNSRGLWHRESHVRYRDYSPTLGRFIERDPIGFEAGDNNWYRFVANGPTKATDPSGLVPFDYPDPDRTQGNASVASIDVSLEGSGLCGNEGGNPTIVVVFTFDVHAGGAPPWGGVNKGPDTLGELEINGRIVRFPADPPAAADSSVATARHSLPGQLPPCSGTEQSGRGTIKLRDLTRTGPRTPNVWTGVSQVYEYTWRYQCSGTEGCCQFTTEFSFEVVRTYNNTVEPNG